MAPASLPAAGFGEVMLWLSAMLVGGVDDRAGPEATDDAARPTSILDKADEESVDDSRMIGVMGGAMGRVVGGDEGMEGRHGQ